MIEQNKNLLNIINAGRKLFDPVPPVAVSVWAGNSRFVSREESARPGLWDNSITPFAVEPMDAFSDDEVERITFMGSAQVVKTEIIKNIIGYNAELEGEPMLLVYPSEDDARDFSTEKLDPMLRYNPNISSKIATEKAHSKENKTLFKKFIEGGFLAISGSNAPQKLARRSVKYVLVDDADRVGAAGQEGDSVSLAYERTESYALLGRKLCEFSTPTIDGASRIQSAFLLSDQRQYYVPCPFCKKEQILNFDNLKWHKDLDTFGNTTEHYPNTVYYECAHCGESIDERYKSEMVEKGKWIPKFADRETHRGYWINRLYSPFSTWEMIVQKFLDTKNDPMKFRVFLNTYLAQTFKIEESRELDDDGLLALVENFCTDEKPAVPNDVLVATGGVDVQADRIEIQLIGWGYGEEAWTLDHQKFYGDTSQNDVWNDLNNYINEHMNVHREDGLPIPVRLIFIDSGFNTDMVYHYTSSRVRVVAVKGQPGYNKPIILNPSKVGKGKRTIMQNVGVDLAKSIIYRRLHKRLNKNKHSGPGVIHFSKKFCDIEYFAQLTAEKAVADYNKRNEKTIIWKKKSQGSRNEILDLWVYAYAALTALKPDWEQLKNNRDKQLEKMHEDEAETKKKKQPKVKQLRGSNFVNGWK